MPEFKRVLVYQVHALPPVDSKRCILQPLRDAPSGSKLLSSTSLLPSGGGSGSSLKLVDSGALFPRSAGPLSVAAHSASSSSDTSSCESVHGSGSDASCARPGESTCDARAFEVRLGVYASPDEFLDGCRGVTHPFDHLHAAPDRLKQCIFDMLVNGPTWVVQRRAALLKKWTSWASDLEVEERALKGTLDPQVAKVLQGKRLKLLERIAGSLGWVDMKVFDELRSGFDLVGHHEHTGVFAHEPRPPKLAEGDFANAAQFLQPALLGKIRASASDANARELWDKTLDEVSDGILEGPLSAEVLSARHGPCWLPTRRFGVEQTSSAGRKLRPVDDFTENKVNLAFGSMDKLDLNALDELIGICRLWIRVLNGPPDFTIPLSTGASLSGRLHDGWKKVGCEPLLTTLDLRSAYKQFVVSAKSRAFAIIALLDPSTGEPGLFESKALPFGSSASVLHFNRLARLFWRIGVELCVPWCNFYDDFPVMSPGGIAANTMETMIALCNLLGFRFASDKLSPFKAQATMLGVEVDCSRFSEGLVLVRNKPGRAEELIASLDEVLEEGLISRKRYLSLMGRLHYTDSYILGKAGRLFMAEVRSWAKAHSGPELKLDDCVRRSLERLLNRLRCGTPRHVPCSVADHVVHIYTDGASKGSSHTVGGVLMFQNQVHTYFGCSVPAVLVSRWAESMCHFIGPIEAYAVAVARKAWHQFIAGHRCIFYIDNVPAQDSFIKGTSANHHVRDILLSFEAAEELSASWSWPVLPARAMWPMLRHVDDRTERSLSVAVVASPSRREDKEAEKKSSSSGGRSTEKREGHPQAPKHSPKAKSQRPASTDRASKSKDGAARLVSKESRESASKALAAAARLGVRPAYEASEGDPLQEQVSANQEAPPMAAFPDALLVRASRKVDSRLEQVLQNAIQRNASSSSEQLAHDRAIFFKTWLSRAKELESEEASFKELLSAYEYPDPEVFDEITHGIRLTGQTPNMGMWMLLYMKRRWKSGRKDGPLDPLVDDMSFSGVNELVTVQESPKPYGPDVVAGPESLPQSYVAHWSVFGFLRAAAAVWWLGCVALGLCWSVFFDDFITIAKSCDIRHTEATVCTFFRLLGWLLDECGSKAVDFSTSFKALGVLFNLAQSHKGFVTISNTPSRIAELTSVISDLLASRKLSRAEAQRLRGRMQFCDGFLFGRASRFSLQAVSRHVHASHDEVTDGDLWDSLLRFHNCLQESRPHVVTANHQESLFLFTDACYEPGADWCAGLGAVVLGPKGNCLGFFSMCASEKVRKKLGEGFKKTIIFELEFLALLVALVHWKELFRNRPLVCYLDNNTSRDVCISGRGRSFIAKALATALLSLEDAGEIRTWFSRVPSPSNIADEPSRKLCESLEVNGVTLVADDASQALIDCVGFLG
ncbi:unnamed protein product [Symbiodinium sp. CCMP2592]|nr:unnamed protein product [Symbiodinium sp. CCMP2592]